MHRSALVILIMGILITSGCWSSEDPGDENPDPVVTVPNDDDPIPDANEEPGLDEFLDVDLIALPPEGWWEITHDEGRMECPEETIPLALQFPGRPPEEMRMETFQDEVFSFIIYDDTQGEQIEFYIYGQELFPGGYDFNASVEVPEAMRIDYYISYNSDNPNIFEGVIISFIENCNVYRPFSGIFLEPFE